MKIKFIYILTIIFLISGCTKNSKSDISDIEIIVHVGETIIDVNEFRAALEVTKLGYPHNDLQNSKIALKEDVLTQLIEEQIIINEAQKKGLIYTKQEFAKDVEAVKKEYPDNIFEEVLKKNAIEFSTWERRFKREMQIKKGMKFLIAKEVTITPKELRQGVIDYCNKNNLNPKDIKNDKEIGLIILEKVKREKSEKRYDNLLEDLKKNYKINIVEDKWKSILESNKY